MKVLFSQANLLRKKPFQLQTIIYKKNKKILVRKNILNNSALEHLNKMKKNSLVIEKNEIKFSKIIDAKSGYIDFEFLPFPSIEYLIEEKIYEQDFESLNHLIKIGIDFINSLKINFINPYQNKNFAKIFDPKESIKPEIEECFNLGILDLNFDNLLLDREKNQIYLIDFEWFFDFPLPKKFIIFRSIFYLSVHMQLLIKNRCSSKFTCFEIIKNFYIPKIFWEKLNCSPYEIKKYYFWEINFQNYVSKIQQKYDENIFVKEFIEKKEKSDNSLYGLSLSQMYQTAQIQSKLEKQQLYIKKLEDQINHLQNQTKNLETQLQTIKSAKFFKLWQTYCVIRKKIIGR